MNGVSRRDLGRAAGALALGASFAGQHGLALAAVAKPASIDPMMLVDPELKAAAAQMQGMEKFLPRSEAELPAIRRMPNPFVRPVLAEVPVAERRIGGSRGQPDVTVYVINARRGESRPAILHIHGGGYILNAAKTEIRGLQDLALALDCTIVTVDYRLAPETRWQGSLEDNYAGLKWLHDNAGELGVDPRRIAVLGESAGGGHAALLALTARDRGEVPIVLHVLVYPMLDDRTGSSRPVPDHIGTLVWTAAANRLGWRSFLGREPGSPTATAGGVPARVENLAGLAPAWIGVGTLDLFVGEDIDYARRLVAAGVPAELHVVPGAFHGFEKIVPDSAVAKQFTALQINAFRRAFGTPMPSGKVGG